KKTNRSIHAGVDGMRYLKTFKSKGAPISLPKHSYWFDFWAFVVFDFMLFLVVYFLVP
uniref:Uncharacterized protein n=1 Tax=Oreochromis niloticus TaxID=8128 RepID=A0A669CIL3_ORENI